MPVTVTKSSRTDSANVRKLRIFVAPAEIRISYPQNKIHKRYCFPKLAQSTMVMITMMMIIIIVMANDNDDNGDNSDYYYDNDYSKGKGKFKAIPLKFWLPTDSTCFLHSHQMD